jgi:hypothetical protein
MNTPRQAAFYHAYEYATRIFRLYNSHKVCEYHKQVET